MWMGVISAVLAHELVAHATPNRPAPAWATNLVAAGPPPVITPPAPMLAAALAFPAAPPPVAPAAAAPAVAVQAAPAVAAASTQTWLTALGPGANVQVGGVPATITMTVQAPPDIVVVGSLFCKRRCAC